MTALNERALAAACKALCQERFGVPLEDIGHALVRNSLESETIAALTAYHASEPDAVAVERGGAESAQQYGSLQVNAAGQVELDKDKVFWSDDGSIWCHIANLYDLAARSQP